ERGIGWGGRAGWGKRMVGADSTFAHRDGSKSARCTPPTPQTGRRRAAGKFAFFAKTPPALSAPGVPKGWPCAGPRAAKVVSTLGTASERRAAGARIPATILRAARRWARAAPNRTSALPANHRRRLRRHRSTVYAAIITATPALAPWHQRPDREPAEGPCS